MEFPYEDIPVNWKRPPVDRDVLQECMKRSDAQGFFHVLGFLGLLTATGFWAYRMYATQQWVWMAVALYVHGGLFTFNNYHHELSHLTVFKTRWLNVFFTRLFDFLEWPGMDTQLFRLSHKRHHTYTLHRRCEGEEVHPRPFARENLLRIAATPVDLTGFLLAVYDKVYAMFVPFMRNPRNEPWIRFCYSKATPREKRAIYGMTIGPFLAHIAFGVAAVMSGMWFLIVVVSLPAFYGGKWYFHLIHNTMHVGCKPETDDFSECCRTVKVDPVSSFLYYHMEWHTEHHTFAGVPCYNLKKLHMKTSDHWKKPMSLRQAWREMEEHSRRMLLLESSSEPSSGRAPEAA
jgi:fatty acid desaturase